MFDMALNYHDARIIKDIVNQGIDSRLEGFTKSTFKWSSRELKLYCNIDDSEMQILIRRLLEYNKSYVDIDNVILAEQLANDIVSVYYGIEII